MPTGYSFDEVNKLQAEITRLRALAVRVRKIEWEPCGEDGLHSKIGNTEFYIYKAFDHLSNSFGYYYAFNGGVVGVSNTIDAAKAACQSALEAWVWQFVEVGE